MYQLVHTEDRWPGRLLKPRCDAGSPEAVSELADDAGDTGILGLVDIIDVCRALVTAGQG
jgi:hypothetical protein